VKACIHRGANQIGGTCIELEAQGKRLILDIGMPLDALDPESMILPEVRGLTSYDPALLGIIISHPHQDHYGMASRVPENTTFLMGAATERILAAAADFTPCGGTFGRVIHMSDRKTIDLGPFRVTPYLMDHSAYDAYAVLIESGGKRLFYTGDLRGHGRKAPLFERLLGHPPEKVNVLLMEGTTVTRVLADEGFSSESDLEVGMTKIFSDTPGMPLVWCSGQNIDRLVTVFRACKKSSRRLILDMYTAHILAATENPNLPQAHWEAVRVYLPFLQKMRIVQDESFEIARKFKLHRIYPEQLADAASRSVMLFRPSMRFDLEKAGCLGGACLVYSMWDGYLNDDRMKRFLTWLKEHQIPLHRCHTSGHAPVKDLKRLRAAFKTANAAPVRPPDKAYVLSRNTDVRKFRKAARSKGVWQEKHWEEACYWKWKESSDGLGDNVPFRKLINYQVMLRGSNADENWSEIDLLGATETNLPVVVELKIKPREYLLRAIVEAAANGIAVCKAWNTGGFRKQWEERVGHEGLPASLKGVQLTVAAPSDCWHRWKGDPKFPRNFKTLVRARASIRNLAARLGQSGYPITFVEIVDGNESDAEKLPRISAANVVDLANS